MKKYSFTLPFKSNFFKEQDPFHLVIVFFIIFFGTAIFFSVPTFYDYKKYNQEIENVINNEFKINLHNLEEISYRFIPSPHLLIKRADLKIKEDEKKIISELKNIKVFISLTDLYSTKKFKIKKILVSKANFYINNQSLLNLIYNLKKNIVNNFIIKKSTLFFKDKNDEIIFISKMKDLDYRIDFVNNKKILKINGNLFDADYNFTYLIDYKNPNQQNVKLELKNPNLSIENILTDKFNSKKNNQIGSLVIGFLNQKDTIDYEIENNNILFKNKKIKNSNFDLNGSINFQPFHFDLTVDLKSINLSEIENIFYKIYLNRNLKYENLSGKIKLNFNKIDFKKLNNGSISLLFENSIINSSNKKFNLGDFAVIEVNEFEYLEYNDQILQMKVKIKILNSEKFNRFLFNYKKNKILSKNIYFTYQYNNSDNTNFISKISSSGFVNSADLYKFNNFQQLKNLIKDENILTKD
tara:strand:- start:4240 stop:5643 length:1404 start_codon:yes stop_codon:yes gene_type:complete